MTSTMTTQSQSQLHFPLSTKSGSSILSDPDEENIVLIFDTETTGLPEKSWDDYEPYDTTERWKDGNLKFTRMSMIRDETTRLPVMDMYGKPTYNYVNKPILASNPDMFPHVVQFSYVLYDRRQNKIIKMFNELVRLEEGVVITPGSQEIHHISLEQTQGQHSDGSYNPSIAEVIDEFMGDFYKADIVIAHNMRFDRNIVLSEMHRLCNRFKNSSSYKFRFEKYMSDYYSNKKEYCTCDYGGDECKIQAISKVGKPYYKMPKLNVLFQHLFNYELDTRKLHNALIDVIVCFCCFYKLRYGINILNDKNIDLKMREHIKYLTPSKCSGCYPIFCTDQRSHMDIGGCRQYVEEQEEERVEVLEKVVQEEVVQVQEEEEEEIVQKVKKDVLIENRRSYRCIKNPVVKYSR